MVKNTHNSCDIGPQAPVKHQLLEMFWTLGPAFTRWAESHMHEDGLSPQRIRLLVLLLDNGPMIMSNLRDELGVTATNVTALVDVLEKDNMVTRKAHKTDRRATVIELTSKAEKLLTENCGEFKDKVSELFSVFSKNEQEQLLKLLLKMRKALVERNILEESDVCTKMSEAKRK